jgi:hypothetical protein
VTHDADHLYGIQRHTERNKREKFALPAGSAGDPVQRFSAPLLSIRLTPLRVIGMIVNGISDTHAG